MDHKREDRTLPTFKGVGRQQQQVNVVCVAYGFLNIQNNNFQEGSILYGLAGDEAGSMCQGDLKPVYRWLSICSTKNVHGW